MAHVTTFVRIVHHVFTIILGQRKANTVIPVFEHDLIVQISDSLCVSLKDIRSALMYLEMKNIIRSVASTHRHFEFCCRDQALATAEAGQALQSSSICTKTDPEVSELEDMMESAHLLWNKHKTIFESAVLYVPCENNETACNERTGCVEFSDKYAAQQYFGKMISQLHDTLGISFFIAARELTSCHGDVSRVILRAMDMSAHDAVFGQLCDSPVEQSQSHAEGPKSPVNNVCTVCSDIGDEDISIICLPCGDCMCEDCFASRFLNESGALPESDTPCARDGETPKPVPDYFTCPNCNQELLPSFWESFPRIFTNAQRSPYCNPLLTLVDVHARIIASVLRKLRCDPLAAVARCPESLQAAGRYAIAFDVGHEVTCFGRTFGSITEARTITVAGSAIANHGLSVAECEKWVKIQHDLKHFDDRSKKLNKAGNRMRLHGSQYYCGKSFACKVQMQSLETICSPEARQCQDCAFTAAELAKDIPLEFVADSERGNREQDVRMCPRCFGGYFINLWCNDLASHHGQAKEFQVKNVCPGNMYIIT